VSFSVPLPLARHFFHQPLLKPDTDVKNPGVLPAAGISLQALPAAWGSLHIGSRLGILRLHAAPGTILLRFVSHTSRILLSAGRCGHRQCRYEARGS
jgi:hypothetical protein